MFPIKKRIERCRRSRAFRRPMICFHMSLPRRNTQKHAQGFGGIDRDRLHESLASRASWPPVKASQHERKLYSFNQFLLFHSLSLYNMGHGVA